jgi:hypothetical protein
MFLGNRMTAVFEPIIKHGLRSDDSMETFVNSSQSTDIASNILISAGLMIFAMLMTWLLLWSYQKDKFLFIAIVSIIGFCFALEVIILVLINMNKYDLITFRVSIGSSVVIGLFYLILILIFFVRFIQNVRAANNYVPPSVQSYIDH